ncbi:hypothetical protein PIB30_018268 [Stylosanthes scabra]|uniref:Uncharacterized protein n=1 Tax=Stylosanthes scabra TaxID=79078 RepID=A0ABU6X672_9FABA|nr:hypothetical protein [Stylosanthes scabra]
MWLNSTTSDVSEQHRFAEAVNEKPKQRRLQLLNPHLIHSLKHLLSLLFPKRSQTPLLQDRARRSSNGHCLIADFHHSSRVLCESSQGGLVRQNIVQTTESAWRKLPLLLPRST